MQRLEVRGAVRPIYGSLDVRRLMYRMYNWLKFSDYEPGTADKQDPQMLTLLSLETD